MFSGYGDSLNAGCHVVQMYNMETGALGDYSRFTADNADRRGLRESDQLGGIHHPTRQSATSLSLQRTLRNMEKHPPRTLCPLAERVVKTCRKNKKLLDSSTLINIFRVNRCSSVAMGFLREIQQSAPDGRTDGGREAMNVEFVVGSP